MRIWLSLALAAVVLSACDKMPWAHKAASPWPDYQHRLATIYRHATALNAGEVERLKAHAELAVRDGKTLKIFHNGKLIKTLVSTDCDKDADNCDTFYFIGPVAVMSPVTHKLEAYAQIGELYYESSGGYWIPLENGETIQTDTEASGSTDGHWLAFGSDVIDDQEGLNNLMIRDMTANKPDIIFAPSCMPNEWTGSARFTALCEHIDDTGDIRFEASASQTADGRWQLTTTRILSYEPLGPAIGAIDPHRVYRGRGFGRTVIHTGSPP